MINSREMLVVIDVSRMRAPHSMPLEAHQPPNRAYPLPLPNPVLAAFTSCGSPTKGTNGPLAKRCKRKRGGEAEWGRLAARGLLCPGRGQTFVVHKSERGEKNLREAPTWARQMQPHTIPLSPAMWFGEQDDRLIGLGYLGQAVFIWKASAGQGPHWCVCYLGQSGWGLGAPSLKGQLQDGKGQGH